MLTFLYMKMHMILHYCLFLACKCTLWTWKTLCYWIWRENPDYKISVIYKISFTFSTIILFFSCMFVVCVFLCMNLHMLFHKYHVRTFIITICTYKLFFNFKFINTVFFRIKIIIIFVKVFFCMFLFSFSPKCICLCFSMNIISEHLVTFFTCKWVFLFMFINTVFLKVSKFIKFRITFKTIIKIFNIMGFQVYFKIFLWLRIQIISFTFIFWRFMIKICEL